MISFQILNIHDINEQIVTVDERPNSRATVSCQKPVYNSTAIYWTENHPIDGCSSYEWKASIYWYSATTDLEPDEGTYDKLLSGFIQ